MSLDDIIVKDIKEINNQEIFDKLTDSSFQLYQTAKDIKFSNYDLTQIAAYTKQNLKKVKGFNSKISFNLTQLEGFRFKNEELDHIEGINFNIVKIEEEQFELPDSDMQTARKVRSNIDLEFVSFKGLILITNCPTDLMNSISNAIELTLHASLLKFIYHSSAKFMSFFYSLNPIWIENLEYLLRSSIDHLDLELTYKFNNKNQIEENLKTVDIKIPLKHISLVFQSCQQDDNKSNQLKNAIEEINQYYLNLINLDLNKLSLIKFQSRFISLNFNGKLKLSKKFSIGEISEILNRLKDLIWEPRSHIGRKRNISSIDVSEQLESFSIEKERVDGVANQ